MPVLAGELYLNVRPDMARLGAQVNAGVAKAATSASAALSKRLTDAGSKFNTVGRSMTRNLTLPIIAVGAAATKMALDYNQAFTRIAAVSNASTADIARWKTEVLDLAKATGRSPMELANGLYFLASAGLKSGQIMDVLKASAEAAAVGLGDTADIARLTANVLNAYAGSGIKAADVTDTLVAAVKAGTADPDEFANAMGRILPIASKAGVGFDQVTASLAGLSNIGLDVNEGVTAMRGLLGAMVAPTSAAAKTMKDLGISTDEMRRVLTEKGLLGAMQLLEQRSHGNIDVLSDLVPNVRSLTGQLGLTGKNAEAVAGIFDQVRNSSGALGEAMETTAADPAFRLQQEWAKLKVAGIDLGNKLIPIVTEFAGAIGNLAEDFTELSPGMQEAIIKFAALAAVAGPALRVVGVGLNLVSGGIKGFTKLMPAMAKVPSALGTSVSYATRMSKGFQGMQLGIAGVGIAIASVGLPAVMETWNNAYGVNQANVDAWTASLMAGEQTIESMTASVEEQNGSMGLLDTVLMKDVGRLNDLEEATQGYRDQWDSLTTSMQVSGYLWGDSRLDIDMVNVALRDLEGVTGEQKASFMQLEHQLLGMQGGLSDADSEILRMYIDSGKLAEGMAFLQRRIDAATPAYERQIAAIVKNKDAQADWGQQVGDIMLDNKEMAGTIGGTINAIYKQGGAIKGMAREQILAAIAAGDLATAQDLLNQKLDSLSPEVRKLSHGVFTSKRAYDQWGKSTQGWIAANKDQGSVLGKEINTLYRMGGALNGAASKAVRARAATGDFAGALQEVKRAEVTTLLKQYGSELDKTTKESIKAKLATGDVEGALADAKAAVEEIPKTKQTKIELEGEEQVNTGLDTMQNKVDDLTGGTHYINFAYRTSGNPPSGATDQAAGGFWPARAGGYHLRVAEAGQDEIVAPYSEYVDTVARAAAGMAGGGGDVAALELVAIDGERPRAWIRRRTSRAVNAERRFRSGVERMNR